MSWGAAIAISPTSLTGISRVPCSASKILTATSGSGIPTDPILFSPFTGLTHSAIIDSVRPYPSTMRPPVIASNRCLVSAISGAAPEKHRRIEVKSTFRC